MLTQKQNRFVEEYALSGNGSKAAILAGYSPRTARAIACENLRKPEIAEAIKHHDAVRRRDREADIQRTLMTLKNIAFGNVRDLLDADGGLKDVADWPEAARDAFRVVTIKQTLKRGKNGKAKPDVQIIKLHMKDKLKALEPIQEVVESGESVVIL